jgi:O-antigen/teichoic acid export membrane protein
MPSIRRNFVYKLLYEILALAAPLITAPYVSRVLGAEGVGIYSYSQSCIAYFTMFAVLGTNIYGMREIARCRDDKTVYSKTFWEIEILTVITSTVCVILWVGITIQSTEYKPYFLALVPTLFASMFDISWFYTGQEAVGYTVFWNAICKIAGVVLIFSFIKSKDDVVAYIMLNSLILMFGNLSMWIFLPKFLVRVSVKSLRIWHHFKETLIYFIPTIATSIYTVLDKTLIGLITNDAYQNGFYEQATKIINIAKTASFVALNSVMGARLAYLFAENKIEEAKSKIKTAMNMILLLTIGSMFGVVAIASDFVPVFFGEGYEPVIDLLYLMAPLIVIIGISNCIGTQYYTPIGKTKIASLYMIAGSVVNLILNILFIPVLGAKGAVIGSIGAEAVITMLFVHFDERYITWKYLLMIGYKKVIAGLLMLLMIRTMSLNLNLSGIVLVCVQVIVGILTYFLMLLLLRDSMIQRFVTELLNRMKGYKK